MGNSYNILEIIGMIILGAWLFGFMSALFMTKKPTEYINKSIELLKLFKSGWKFILTILIAYIVMKYCENDSRAPLYILGACICLWIISLGISFWAKKPNEFLNWSLTHFKKYWAILLTFFITLRLCATTIQPTLSF